jgi:hypothetical protein
MPRPDHDSLRAASGKLAPQRTQLDGYAGWDMSL